MPSLKSLLFALPLAVLPFAYAPDAAACGGCFHGEGENTQVTGHRMIFSISKTSTTLWDQFSYANDPSSNPSSFAWVLPVKGTPEIGLSSDALFGNLDAFTQVQVAPPPLNCPLPSCYDFGSSGSSSSGGFGGGASGGPVTVVAESVVGPYETATLQSSDPNALADWLTTHGYNIQPDFAPTISAYIAEGFNFLALKLMPGKDVTSMKPVRVTTQGAGATLPLRMVAAGVGVTTPITLWILGEGRYQPTNFPWFLVTEQQLVWDFSTSSSNYKALRQAGYDATDGRGWLVETSSPFSAYSIGPQLQDLAMYDPVGSGYGDDQGNGAVAAVMDDLDKLYGGIDQTAMWLTRTRAELPRAALAVDLTLGAAATQSLVSGNLTAKKGINVPECPTYPPCPESTGGAGGAGGATSGAGGAGANGSSGGGSGSGCAVGGESERSAAFGAIAVVLGLALARRRRSRWGTPKGFPKPLRRR